MHIQPMLASNEEWNLEDLCYPVIVTPKYDGIRAIRYKDGELLTRRQKQIPNLFIRNRIKTELKDLPGLFDMEIICGEDYHETESAVMSETHEREHDAVAIIFDYIGVGQALSTPYHERLNTFSALGFKLDHCMISPDKVINNEQDLLSFVQYIELLGMEGVIVRNPNGPYKQGRCTVKSQFMLKLVRYETDEAMVVGWEPAMENLDTSCKKRGNLRPKQMVGSLQCVNSRWPKGFSVGSGWSHEVAKSWYNNRDLILGKTIKFKFKPYGTKDAPRQPVWLGFRDRSID